MIAAPPSLPAPETCPIYAEVEQYVANNATTPVYNVSLESLPDFVAKIEKIVGQPLGDVTAAFFTMPSPGVIAVGLDVNGCQIGPIQIISGAP